MGISEPSLIDFAIDVADRLASIAQGVGQSGNSVFCEPLSAGLWLIKQQLQDQEPADAALKNRLVKLLNNLERLCKPKSSSPYARKPSPYQANRSAFSLSSRYPELTSLRQDNRKHAVDGIRRIALGRNPEAVKRQTDLLKIVQTFSGPLMGVDDTPAPKTKNEVWVGDDFTVSIQTLHQVLSEYTSCISGEEKREITGKLRLAIENGPAHDAPMFDLMFLAHPHNEVGMEPRRWRETRIRVNRRKATKFKDLPDEEVQVTVGGPNHITDFCERISTREQYQLSLMVSDEQLHFVEWCEGAKFWVPNSPTVSLSTILKNHKLSKKMKYLLSYLLAKSVWQFYDTEWMGKEWTKDSIHFMFERRQHGDTAGIYLNEPFVSARFDPDSGKDDSIFRIHRFPKIKALGIVLLEIELGTTIEDHYGPDCYAPDGQLNTDADIYAAIKLYKDPETLEDSFPLLKSVIGECLMPSKFVPHRNSVEELRGILQKHVVDDLHTIIGYYDQPDKVELRPTFEKHISQLYRLEERKTLAYSVSQREIIASEVRPIEYQHQKPRKPTNFGGSVSSCIPQASSESWFDDLDSLNEILTASFGETDETYKKVRVAVIDTGIKGNDSYARRIHDYKDFVTGNDALKQDRTGHGTNSVKLIFTVFAEAEVYVARVFDTNEADEDTQDLMLEAVEYANKVWKADIISIASGFEKDHPLMRRAIKTAASEGTLVFAAASNYGNIRQVTFPARMKDVICVYCTDGRAKVSSSINPAPQTTKTRNFAILGEDVMVPPSIVDRVTGTSVATCIAAGLAGKLLDFSRQKDAQCRIGCVANLASIEGMSAVFSHMAKGADDYKYNCVVPSRLLQHLEEDWERSLKRERICEKLSAALENIDLD